MAVVLLTAPIEGAPFHRAHSGSRRSTQPSHHSFFYFFLHPEWKAPLKAGDWTVLHCAHRAIVIHLDAPSKLARYLFRDGG
jgi:hypothetical protein